MTSFEMTKSVVWKFELLSTEPEWVLRGFIDAPIQFFKQLKKKKTKRTLYGVNLKAIREFTHKNSQKHLVNLAENLELVLGNDHVIHIEKKKL